MPRRPSPRPRPASDRLRLRRGAPESPGEPGVPEQPYEQCIRVVECLGRFRIEGDGPNEARAG